MRRLTAILMVLALILSGFALAEEQRDYGLPVKVDPGLDNALHGLLGLRGDMAITTVNLEQLTTLKAVGRGVKDINALGYAKNLSVADLSDNEITDIRALSRLKNLGMLNINDNPGPVWGYAVYQALLESGCEVSVENVTWADMNGERKPFKLLMLVVGNATKAEMRDMEEAMQAELVGEANGLDIQVETAQIKNIDRFDKELEKYRKQIDSAQGVIVHDMGYWLNDAKIDSITEQGLKPAIVVFHFGEALVGTGKVVRHKTYSDYETNEPAPDAMMDLTQAVINLAEERPIEENTDLEADVTPDLSAEARPKDTSGRAIQEGDMVSVTYDMVFYDMDGASYTAGPFSGVWRIVAYDEYGGPLIGHHVGDTVTAHVTKITDTSAMDDFMIYDSADYTITITALYQ